MPIPSKLLNVVRISPLRFSADGKKPKQAYRILEMVQFKFIGQSVDY